MEFYSQSAYDGPSFENGSIYNKINNKDGLLTILHALKGEIKDACLWSW